MRVHGKETSSELNKFEESDRDEYKFDTDRDLFALEKTNCESDQVLISTGRMSLDETPRFGDLSLDSTRLS